MNNIKAQIAGDLQKARQNAVIAENHLSYLTAMETAQSDWAKNHLADLSTMLTDLGDKLDTTGDDHERGFEWDYWHRRLSLEWMTLQSKTSMPIYALAASPDGRWIAAGGKSGAIEFWDAATGHSLYALPGHGGPISAIAFSSDGQRFAVGSNDGRVEVRATVTGELLAQPEATAEGRHKIVTAVAFSPDYETVAISDGGGALRLW